MNILEPVAAAFGVISIYLGTRQNMLIWPTAIINVALYGIVFRESRLYADMGLQVVYLILAVYGWYEWRYGGAEHTRLKVSRARPRTLVILAGLNLVAWLLLASLLHRYTNAAIPWLDSLLTTSSLLAQWMMTRKILENWTVWIVLDLIYVPMFISRGLWFTAANYAIYLVLAFMGLRDWRKSLNTGAVPMAS